MANTVFQCILSNTFSLLSLLILQQCTETSPKICGHCAKHRLQTSYSAWNQA